MPKRKYTKRIPDEVRSAIASKAGRKSVEMRINYADRYGHRPSGHPMAGIPVKRIAVYSPDFIFIHRLAKAEGKLKLDIVHEALELLKPRLEEAEEAERQAALLKSGHGKQH